MTGKTITRVDLSEAVVRKVGLSRYESTQLVDRVLAIISDALVEEGQVKIASFGTFSTRDKNARIGRNPITGEEAPIIPRRVAVFQASSKLKARVKSGNCG